MAKRKVKIKKLVKHLKTKGKVVYYCPAHKAYYEKKVCYRLRHGLGCYDIDTKGCNKKYIIREA